MIVRYFIISFLLFCLGACSSRARLEVKKRNIPKHQLLQNYTDLSQKLRCGQEPIVRFANFTFDIQDSLQIKIDLTTSLNESKIKGDLSIFLDEYEIEYANTPSTKQYLETLEVESQSRYPYNFQGRQSLVNTIIRNATYRKNITKNTKEQYWNAVSIVIEPEDVLLLMASSDIYFSMKTERCELIIYPSFEQVKELKKFLRKAY